MMNLKECGRQWPNLRYDPGFCPEKLRKTMKPCVRIAGFWTKI
jgi:hypothetical protein